MLHRNQRDGEGIPESFTTIAELFQAAGWETFLWSTNMYVGRQSKTDQGFDSVVELIPLGEPKGTIDDFIERVNSSYSFDGAREFHYFHLMDTHLPYSAPDRFQRMMAPEYHGKNVRQGALYDQKGDSVVSNFPYFSEQQDVRQEDIEFLISLYDASIRYCDDRLPVLLDTLSFDPSRDLLILSADHGEQFFEHGFWGHTRSMHIEELHVPLLMRFDGFAPAVREEAVSLLDLYPTLADFIGVTSPSGVIGASLLPTLQGHAPRTGYVVCEGSDVYGPTGVAIGGGWFYYMNTRWHFREPWQTRMVDEQLFDLNTDPRCRKNVLRDRLDMADTMNFALRGLNPRWAQATPETIRPTQDPPALGPNLFRHSEEGEVQWEAAGRRTTAIRVMPGGVELEAPEWEVLAKAAREGRRREHLFDVEYDLRSGVLYFALVDPLSNQVFWTYEAHRPTSGVKTLQAVVLPSETVELRVSVSRGGSASIADPRLRFMQVREVPVPELDVVPDPALPPPMPDDDKERLKALGYTK